MKHEFHLIHIFAVLVVSLALERDDYKGGWNDNHDSWLTTQRCNIRKIHQKSVMSADEFRKYFEDEPVIIVGAPAVLNVKTRNLCQKSELLKMYGDLNVTLSSANTFSHARRIVKFSDYVDQYLNQHTLDQVANETWYLFGDNNHSEWKEIFQSYIEQDFFYDHERLNGRESSLSFGIGGSGSGVPFHVHGPGFSEVLWGRKRWFLMPKGVQPDFDPDETTSSHFFIVPSATYSLQACVASYKVQLNASG
uniref:JmjC domain-containing protein n=1 Tax=Guillardia theta TaxID=55529 RepID=A0A7S4KQQ8_GUITH|mmetsp:Transcript_29225/g.93901  ORF Transcript_29225/g.93901 Transcript_29225/m.93901 type:complete len:250 (+) Transcript_29225:283-1032(+)